MPHTPQVAKSGAGWLVQGLLLAFGSLLSALPLVAALFGAAMALWLRSTALLTGLMATAHIGSVASVDGASATLDKQQALSEAPLPMGMEQPAQVLTADAAAAASGRGDAGAPAPLLPALPSGMLLPAELAAAAAEGARVPSPALDADYWDAVRVRPGGAVMQRVYPGRMP
jgi:hypothetical protein